MSTLKFDTWQDSAGANEFYKCRAFVHFNGIGTLSIQAAGNVSSVTDNGVGDYTVNFTNAMPDANYTAAMSVSGQAATNTAVLGSFTDKASSYAAGSLRVTAINNSNAAADREACCVAIFR